MMSGETTKGGTEKIKIFRLEKIDVHYLKTKHFCHIMAISFQKYAMVLFFSNLETQFL